MSIQDLKLAALSDYTGSLYQRECAWLTGLGYSGSSLQQRWFAYLGDLGYVGSIEDRFTGYLMGLGYTGSRVDMTVEALNDGVYYGSVELVFHAAAPDNDGVMQLQVTGSGTPTAEHTATIYARDEATGYYNAFGADKPVFSGGRFVDEDTVSAEDAGGTPYAEPPYLQYSPAATNLFEDSTDATGWPDIGTPTVTYNQVGLGGLPNSATWIEDTDAGAQERVYDTVAMTGDTTFSGSIWIAYEDDETYYPVVRLYMYGGTAKDAYVWVNRKTGATTITGADAGNTTVDVVRDNAFWRINFSRTDTGTNTSFRAQIYGAAGTVFGTLADAATGHCILGQIQGFNNTSLAVARGLPPALTSGATASIDRIPYAYDYANHDVTQGAYYLVWKPTVSSDDAEDAGLVTIRLSYGSLLYSDNHPSVNIRCASGATSLEEWLADSAVKVALVYDLDENKSQMCVNGVWGNEAGYVGIITHSILQLFYSATRSNAMRDLRRYSGGTYDQLKDQIDELMAE